MSVERVACPWLITLFVDNPVDFLFVPDGEIETTVRGTGAVPFDPKLEAMPLGPTYVSRKMKKN